MAANILDAIMLVGDSITQAGWDAGGFAQKLAYVYNRKLDVVNRGLSGYNTEWGLIAFKQFFAKKGKDVPTVRLLTIWFGANDACLQQSPQYLPLERFVSNLQEFINLVRSPNSDYYSPSTKIILITPPPINEAVRKADLASRNPPVQLDRKLENTKLYAEAVIKLGKEERIPVVDMFSLIWDAAEGKESNLPKYLSDGLHLTTEAYQVLYDDLLRVISTDYPELHHDKLPMLFPPWAEIDWQNPQFSLTVTDKL